MMKFLLVVLASTGAAAVLASSTVAVAGYPTCPMPTVAGPLSGGPVSGATSCVFDYVLDPATTSDPGDSWHAYWGSETTPPARRGWCTIDVLEDIHWGTKTAVRTYPRLGSTAVRPGAVARLTVDADGHATAPASLQQKADWPAGIVTATSRPGRLVVVWQGRTTRGIPLVIGAEVVNPGMGAQPDMAGWSQSPYQIGVPCAHTPPPGPGFLARMVPASIPRGQKGWLELRIPGTGPREPSVNSLSSVAGTVTITIGSGRPMVLGMTDRYAVAIPNYSLFPVRVPVKVKLHGPTGTRNYRISVVFR